MGEKIREKFLYIGGFCPTLEILVSIEDILSL